MHLKKAVSLESLIFMLFFMLFFVGIGQKMGGVNMINTMMNTAYDILVSTVFYIMAIAVLAGAISELLSEFGVITIANKLLSPFMKVYDLPGASAIGVFSTYLSDNPAILTLAGNKSFRRYFKMYQLPALTNVGTAFGMGLIITTFMIGITAPTGESFIAAALIGNLGAVVGSVVSTRIMLRFTVKEFGKEEGCKVTEEEQYDIMNFRPVREGSGMSRFLGALLDGGSTGVQMGIAIIPGVLIICTIILMLTNGPSDTGLYTGAAYEGIGLLPFIGEKLQFILKPLFGFSSPECIAVPITSLGAAGAAISLVPEMAKEGIVHANDIAVFTAMCMCFSGYLSTHVAMMESLGFRKLTGKAIISHTIGGLAAGVSANLLYQLFVMIS